MSGVRKLPYPICKNCKITFRRDESSRDDSLYCSTKCSGEYKSKLFHKEFLRKIENNEYDYNDVSSSKIIRKHYNIVLKKGECIHHRDGNTKNNKRHNLMILSRSEHQKLHSLAYQFIVKMGLIQKYLIDIMTEIGVH